MLSGARAWARRVSAAPSSSISQRRATLDPSKRKDIYDRAQRLMVDKAIQIWTFAPDMIDVTQAGVQYQQHFTTNYYGFRTVSLDK